MHSGFCSPKNLHYYNDCYDWMVSASAQAPEPVMTLTKAEGHHWCCCFLLGLQECLWRFSSK